MLNSTPMSTTSATLKSSAMPKKRFFLVLIFGWLVLSSASSPKTHEEDEEEYEEEADYSYNEQTYDEDEEGATGGKNMDSNPKPHDDVTNVRQSPVSTFARNPTGFRVGQKPPFGPAKPSETPKLDSKPTYSVQQFNNELGPVNVGLIVPHSTFMKRQYMQKIAKSFDRVTSMPFFQFTAQEVTMRMLGADPSPLDILQMMCEDFLPKRVAAILYLANSDEYHRSGIATTQYFIQLAVYLRIPVITWNADNPVVEKKSSQSNMLLQLAPSVEHQAKAMLDLLIRYKWHQFAIVTTKVPGYADFVQSVRDRILELQQVLRFTILDHILVTGDPQKDLARLKGSEARVLLLYCNKGEAIGLLDAAHKLGFTTKDYIWIVSRNVIGNEMISPSNFPQGMLGVHFDTSQSSLMEAISQSLKLVRQGLKQLSHNPQLSRSWISPNLSCTGENSRTEMRWKFGNDFFRHLRNSSLPGMGSDGQDLEFNPDGKLNAIQLRIMNLKADPSGIRNSWEEIGLWKSWLGEGDKALNIRDIVWPGGAPIPPDGVPEKFHLRVTFMEEPPYVNMNPPDSQTGKCSANRGVPCRIATEADVAGLNKSAAMRNSSLYKCCTGFCIDLLEKLAHDLGFSYDLFRVEDGKWGSFENGKWNGLVLALLNRKADIAMTSLKVNSDRAKAIDFSVPFLDTGIAIVVAKRTGIISTTAFLEPFDKASWILVALVAIQVATLAIFMFEWLSPWGYDMKAQPPPGHSFSLLRVYWLVWAILFQAAVNVDCPRGYTSRFMASVWATFAVVFLAIYTANLAAFMITREKYHDLKGIEDPRLTHPRAQDPPFRFGTIPHGNTEAVLKRNYPEMMAYMRRYNRSSVLEGIRSVKHHELDAFVYDATVLDYLVGQDDECKLLTVGSWYAMTGYGIGFPKGSRYISQFNQQMLRYRENGYLERLQNFWLKGACRPKVKQNAAAAGSGGGSASLSINQFLSAFLLLAAGMSIAIFFFGIESFYFKYFRRLVVVNPAANTLFSLLSASMGRQPDGGGDQERSCYSKEYSLCDSPSEPGKPLGSISAYGESPSTIGTVVSKECPCTDPICKRFTWEALRELELSKARIQQLEQEMRYQSQQQQQETYRNRTSGDAQRLRSATSLRSLPSSTPGEPEASISREALLAAPRRSVHHVQEIPSISHLCSDSYLAREARPIWRPSFTGRRPRNGARRTRQQRPKTIEIAEIETVL